MVRFGGLRHSGQTGRDSNIAALTGSHTAVAAQVSWRLSRHAEYSTLPANT